MPVLKHIRLSMFDSTRKHICMHMTAQMHMYTIILAYNNKRMNNKYEAVLVTDYTVSIV